MANLETLWNDTCFLGFCKRHQNMSIVFGYTMSWLHPKGQPNPPFAMFIGNSEATVYIFVEKRASTKNMRDNTQLKRGATLKKRNNNRSKNCPKEQTLQRVRNTNSKSKQIRRNGGSPLPKQNSEKKTNKLKRFKPSTRNKTPPA